MEIRIRAIIDAWMNTGPMTPRFLTDQRSAWVVKAVRRKATVEPSKLLASVSTYVRVCNRPGNDMVG